MVYDIFLAWLPLILLLIVWFLLGQFASKRIKKFQDEVVWDESRPKGALTLIREIKGTDLLRKYKIFVDDKFQDEISTGETKHIILQPGLHKVCLKIDWCSSNVVEIGIDELENNELHCGANYNNWKCTFMWLLKPKNWIYLK